MDETDPNILITKQNTFGMAEYDQRVSVHLRIGDKSVFSDISLPEALAGVIQIHFCFNTLYSPDLDDSLQFWRGSSVFLALRMEPETRRTESGRGSESWR